MNQKAYKALEYYKIVNMLTDKASSSMGKEICRKLEPSTDIDEIRHMQTQTRDATYPSFQKGNISFGSVKRCAWFSENVWKSEVLWGLVNFLPSAAFLRTPIVSKLIPEVSAVILSRTLWTGCSRHWNH